MSPYKVRRGVEACRCDLLNVLIQLPNPKPLGGLPTPEPDASIGNATRPHAPGTRLRVVLGLRAFFGLGFHAPGSAQVWEPFGKTTSSGWLNPCLNPPAPTILHYRPSKCQTSTPNPHGNPWPLQRPKTLNPEALSKEAGRAAQCHLSRCSVSGARSSLPTDALGGGALWRLRRFRASGFRGGKRVNCRPCQCVRSSSVTRKLDQAGLTSSVLVLHART